MVPYNPYLTLKYNAHINLEICISVSAVKYLFKYIHKGNDKAQVRIESAEGDHPAPVGDGTVGHHMQPPIGVLPIAGLGRGGRGRGGRADRGRQGGISGRVIVGGGEVRPPIAVNSAEPRVIDEIEKFILSRYVSAPEAYWRILGIPLSSHYPPVQRLQLHLEDDQTIIYAEGSEQAAVLAAATNGPPPTTLTRYFEIVKHEMSTPLSIEALGADSNGVSYPAATELTYMDIPTYYTWQSNKTWSRRKRPHKCDTIGRMYTAHPSSGEKFYLRLLLCMVCYFLKS